MQEIQPIFSFEDDDVDDVSSADVQAKLRELIMGALVTDHGQVTEQSELDARVRRMIQEGKLPQGKEPVD